MTWEETASVTLENEHVRLRPLTPGDRNSIHAIAMEPDIWHYFVTMIESESDFDTFFDTTIADHVARSRVVYHITDKSSGRTAGSMSFGNMAEAERRVEIGWSWLGLEFQGKLINRWAKYLMLEHAFERIKAERVEFKTDRLNEQARRGLRNIGAVEEGTLRSFNPMPGGRRRDAVYCSVLRAEWPYVKEHLATRQKVTSVG